MQKYMQFVGLLKKWPNVYFLSILVIQMRETLYLRQHMTI